MSVDASSVAPDPAELAPAGDGAFASLMDALVGDEGGATSGEGGGAPAAGAAGDGGAGAGAHLPTAGDGAAAPVAGSAAPATAGTAAAGGPDGAAAGSADGAAAPAGAGDLPASWTADPATLIPRLGELTTKIEERTTQSYQQAALAEVQAEHAQYFDALRQHPRLLVGKQVPAIGKEGTETLRDASDAREWQDAVKSILVEEINGRAEKKLDESGDFLATVHQSVELFQNNPDLIPGARTFDRDLANRFAELVKPYELRVDGKLQGYSIPVQPIVESVRALVKAERAARPAAPAAPSPVAGAADRSRDEAGRFLADAPQAGIPSKAGASPQGEDFSTLFGTIGLPGLKI